MAYLTIFTPQGITKIPLTFSNAIGRQTSNDIIITDPSVSKNHCRIEWDGKITFSIVDLGSTNGTFVNDKKIDHLTHIVPGDTIRVGNIPILLEKEKLPTREMVVISETVLGHFSSTLAPDPKSRFLPEALILDDKVLRADYEKLRVTNELERELNLERDITKTLDRILEKTNEFLKYDQGVILLADQSGIMMPHNYKSCDGAKGKFTVSKTLVHYVSENRVGVISTDVPADTRFNLAESIMMRGIKSTMAAPIMFEDEILGIMIISSTARTNAFSNKDLGLITAITAQVARILKTATLHEELRQTFDSAIRTLSATVDARHPLTAGHSQRVAELSLILARKMQLSERRLRILQLATLMHDIGKIAIPDAILLKNGRFTAEEKKVMDAHPQKSKEILENFYFPEKLREIPDIAGSHHEKIDGTGYPKRMKGETIPLATRVMSVADVFDALTSKRDYPKYIEGRVLAHDRMPIDMAVDVIRQGSGHHFDPLVVKVFVECLPEIAHWHQLQPWGIGG